MLYSDIRNASGKRRQLCKLIYDAWGKLLKTEYVESNLGSLHYTVAEQNPFRYRGYYYDTETGFYFLKSRYYDPKTGRFISADGQLNDGLLGRNLYAYCENNPVMYVDPSGNFAISLTVLGLITGAIIGATVGGVIAYNVAKNNDVEGWELFGWTMMGVVGGALGTGVGALVSKITGIIGFSITKYSILPIKSITVLGNIPNYISAAQATGSGFYLISEQLWNSLSNAERLANNIQYIKDAYSLGTQFAIIPDKIVKIGTSLWEEISYLIENAISWFLY